MIRNHRLVLWAMGPALAASGLVAATVSTASAASCSVTLINSGWALKNNSCSSARWVGQYDNGNKVYGPWVGKGKVSTNGICYANMHHFGWQVVI